VTPDEEARPIPLLTGSIGFILNFAAGPTCTLLRRRRFSFRLEIGGYSKRVRCSKPIWSRCRQLVPRTLFVDAFK
jgi:hypothetical protein